MMGINFGVESRACYVSPRVRNGLVTKNKFLLPNFAVLRFLDDLLGMNIHPALPPPPLLFVFFSFFYTHFPARDLCDGISLFFINWEGGHSQNDCNIS